MACDQKQPQATLLCIDEVGYLSYSNRHADLLFEIISRRYEKKSTLVTTNKAFSEWAEIFPNAACVVSLIDRLVHHSEIIHIDAESYRVKESREKSSRQKATRAQLKKASIREPTIGSKTASSTAINILPRHCDFLNSGKELI